MIRYTSFRGDATVGAVRRQLLLDGGHPEGATSSLAAVATSFRLKRAMARIWFRTTGEGKAGGEPRAWVSGDGLLLCWVGVGHRLSIRLASSTAPPTSTCLTLASPSTGMHCCGREVHGIEGPPPECCIWIFAEVHFMSRAGGIRNSVTSIPHQ